MKVNHVRLDRVQARLQQQADREMERIMDRIIQSMSHEEILATIAELDADIDREKRTILIRPRSEAERKAFEAL